MSRRLSGGEIEILEIRTAIPMMAEWPLEDLSKFSCSYCELLGVVGLRAQEGIRPFDRSFRVHSD